jgi:hypothetical protein
MTVMEFPRALASNGWQQDELQQVMGACAGPVASGDASDWSVGATERGDPQFYLVGSAPDYDCILSVSRLGRLYVMEDGSGNVLLEHNSLLILAEQARSYLQRRKAALVARLAALWCAVREAFEEKLEPMLAEPAELLTHVAPQLAALA